MAADGDSMDRIVKIKSKDGQIFDVTLGTIKKSKLIMTMLEQLGDSTDAIPLPNVDGSTLKKVIEWLEHHKEEPEPAEEESDPLRMRISTDISEWDKEFFTVDQPTLQAYILAANYLSIKPLLDIGCKTVANMIKGKTTEQLRDLFGLEDDFTDEERAAIKREYAWADDDENQAAA